MFISTIKSFINLKGTAILLLSTNLLLVACDKKAENRTKPARKAETGETHTENAGTPNKTENETATNENPNCTTDENGKTNCPTDANGNPLNGNPNGDPSKFKGTLNTENTNENQNPPPNPNGPNDLINVTPPVVDPNLSQTSPTPNNSSDNSGVSTNPATNGNGSAQENTSNNDQNEGKKKSTAESRSSRFTRDILDEDDDDDIDHLEDDDDDVDLDDEETSGSKKSTSKKSSFNKSKDTRELKVIRVIIQKMDKIFANAWFALTEDEDKNPDNYFKILEKRISKDKLFVKIEGKDTNYSDGRSCKNKKSLVLNKSKNAEKFHRLYSYNCDKKEYEGYGSSSSTPILEFKKLPNNEWELKFSLDALKLILPSKLLGTASILNNITDEYPNFLKIEPHCTLSTNGAGDLSKLEVKEVLCQDLIQHYKPNKKSKEPITYRILKLVTNDPSNHNILEVTARGLNFTKTQNEFCIGRTIDRRAPRDSDKIEKHDNHNITDDGCKLKEEAYLKLQKKLKKEQAIAQKKSIKNQQLQAKAASNQLPKSNQTRVSNSPNTNNPTQTASISPSIPPEQIDFGAENQQNLIPPQNAPFGNPTAFNNLPEQMNQEAPQEFNSGEEMNPALGQQQNEFYNNPDHLNSNNSMNPFEMDPNAPAESQITNNDFIPNNEGESTPIAQAQDLQSRRRRQFNDLNDNNNNNQNNETNIYNQEQPSNTFVDENTNGMDLSSQSPSNPFNSNSVPFSDSSNDSSNPGVDSSSSNYRQRPPRQSFGASRPMMDSNSSNGSTQRRRNSR